MKGQAHLSNFDICLMLILPGTQYTYICLISVNWAGLRGLCDMTHNGVELGVGETGVKENASECQRKLFCCLDVIQKVIVSKIYDRAWSCSKRVLSYSNMVRKGNRYNCDCFDSHSDIVALEHNCVVVIANLSGSV